MLMNTHRDLQATVTAGACRKSVIYRAGESRDTMLNARGQLPDCTLLNRANEGLSPAQWAAW